MYINTNFMKSEHFGILSVLSNNCGGRRQYFHKCLWISKGIHYKICSIVRGVDNNNIFTNTLCEYYYYNMKYFGIREEYIYILYIYLSAWMESRIYVNINIKVVPDVIIRPSAWVIYDPILMADTLCVTRFIGIGFSAILFLSL